MKKKTKLLNISLSLLTSSILPTQADPIIQDKVIPGSVAENQPVKPSTPVEKKVQLAILLDTSGSMSGLIEQTKSQLWKIVNTFNDAEKDGQVPFVEVALYEYGNSKLVATSHYIRQISPLTRDLDELSDQLFSLTTSGGEEYCGAVITRSLADLKWDPSPHTYKAIFIAGNEPFTQGPITPQSSCSSAKKKGVIVNTIHCGPEQSGIAGGWQNGAHLASGTFLTINQDQAVAHIEAPQDKLILDLNIQLNKTYIPYGTRGRLKLQSQTTNDARAHLKEKAGASVQRAITKSSKNYHNASWDLCDACHQVDFDWTTVEKKHLPKDLQKLSDQELKKHVAASQAQRKQIQSKIQKLNKERQSYISQKQTELAETSDNDTLDQVVQESIRQQATKKGYTFK